MRVCLVDGQVVYHVASIIRVTLDKTGEKQTHSCLQFPTEIKEFREPRLHLDMAVIVWALDDLDHVAKSPITYHHQQS
jgi:hypothetical protein